MVGKIFTANIYFTDMSSHKIRPILLMHAYRDEDFLYLPLTTNLNLPGILISSSELLSGQLQKPSVIIVPKIAIIHQSLILKELGELKRETFAAVMAKVCNELACKSYTISD